jgi:hypothetical protein
MGAIRPPLPVKLVMPMIGADAALVAAVEGALTAEWGAIDYRSASVPFTYTDYYAREFGPHLWRRFVSFERLIDPGELAGIKRLSNEIEQRWAEAGRRRINLDPGYLTQARLVLATTKDQAHRIYIGQGIYAEVTLIYRGGAFTPLPWTYPDYRSPAYLAILGEIRAILSLQFKAARPGGAVA